MKQFLPTMLLLWLSTNVSAQGIRMENAEQCDARLKSHTDAFRDWVDNRLDLAPDQNAKLEGLVVAELQASSKRRRTAGGVRSFGSLPSMTPIWFTLQRNIGNFLCSEWVTSNVPELLSDRQRITWLKAMSERRQWILSANSNFVIGVVDHLVFLSDGQRDSMSEAIRLVVRKSRRKRLELESGLFRFPSKKSILPTSQLYLFLSGPPLDLVNSGQKLILDGHSIREVMRGDRHPVIAPVAVNPADERRMKESLADFRDQQRPRFAKYVEERVAALNKGVSLTESQQRHLIVAGKGATKRCLFQWQTITINNLKQMRKQIRALNRPSLWAMEMNVQGPSVQTLEQDLIWRHAIAAATSTVEAERKRPFRRKAIVDYVTAMLDKELWLSPDQREPLSVLVDASFPPAINIEQPQAKELELLVTPLFRIPDDELASVLRKSQRKAWKSLQAEFERRGDHVVLPLKDGSEVSFHVSP